MLCSCIFIFIHSLRPQKRPPPPQDSFGGRRHWLCYSPGRVPSHPLSHRVPPLVLPAITNARKVGCRNSWYTLFTTRDQYFGSIKGNDLTRDSVIAKRKSWYHVLQAYSAHAGAFPARNLPAYSIIKEVILPLIHELPSFLTFTIRHTLRSFCNVLALKQKHYIWCRYRKDIGTHNYLLFENYPTWLKKFGSWQMQVILSC